MTTVANRAGFAVATAVFALGVVGALALGTLFSATHELRAGSDTIHQARAIMAAELGTERTVAMWSRQWNGALARGFTKMLTFSTPEAAEVTVNVARLADELFLISSEARAGPARRQVARVVRLDTEDPSLLAALGAGRPVEVGHTLSVDEIDRSPIGWDCPPEGAPIVPFVIADTSELLRFGHFDWSELVEAANTHPSHHVAGVAPQFTDEECDTANPANWGEPTRSNGGACTAYFPVVHAPSDLVIDGGRGQGLLLVDGDLTLQGGFEFFGAVLVRGSLRGGPGGARITGSVSMAGQGATEPVLDGIAIQFSRCAARKALIDLAVPTPLVERSWYEAFAQQ